MRHICVFKKGLDIQETVPHLSVNLNEAIKTGTVKDVGVASEPNGIDDVDAVGSRVEDAFEAFDAMHNVRNDKSGSYVNQPSNESNVAQE